MAMVRYPYPLTNTLDLIRALGQGAQFAPRRAPMYPSPTKPAGRPAVGGPLAPRPNLESQMPLPSLQPGRPQTPSPLVPSAGGATTGGTGITPAPATTGTPSTSLQGGSTADQLWGQAVDAAAQQREYEQWQQQQWQQMWPQIWQMLLQAQGAYRDPNWLRSTELEAEEALAPTYTRALGRLQGNYAGRGPGMSSMLANAPAMVERERAGAVGGVVRQRLGERQDRERQALIDLMSALGLIQPGTAGLQGALGAAGGYSQMQLGRAGLNQGKDSIWDILGQIGFLFGGG